MKKLHQGGSTDRRPLITIVVPTFNSMTGNKSIERLLESVFNQTYDNLEVIIVDNKSTDRTPEICKKFPVIFVQSKSTISEANNIGLGLARGDHVLFLDSDMELQPQFLEDCMRLVESKDSDCIQIEFEHAESRETKGINIVKLRNSEIELGASPTNIYLYSRRIIGNTRFPESKKPIVGEDYIFRRKILNRNSNVGIVETKVFHYYDPSMAWVVERSWKYGKWFQQTKKHLPTGQQIEFIRYNSVIKWESLMMFIQLIRKKPKSLFLFFLYIFVKYASFALGYLSSL